MKNTFKVLFLSACFGMLAAPAFAELDTPSETIVLTVSGEISHNNADDTAVFDVAMLSQLGAVTFETTTIWTEGTQVFEGVPLKTLLDAVGVTSGIVSARAVNDYAIEIPYDEIESGAPIVAFSRNGVIMPLRDKGPLWIVYPYDSDDKYRTEVVYSRSIWQLDRIEVSQ